MKAHIVRTSEYEKGVKDAIGYFSFALHNLYGWKRVPLTKISEEVIRIANIVHNDADEKSRLDLFIEYLEGKRDTF